MFADKKIEIEVTRTKRTKTCYGFHQEKASKGVFVVDNNSWFHSKSLGRTSEKESTKVARPFLDENLVKKTHYCQTQDGTWGLGRVSKVKKYG